MINIIRNAHGQSGLFIFLVLISGVCGTTQNMKANQLHEQIPGECIVYKGTLGYWVYHHETGLMHTNLIFDFTVIVGNPEWKIITDVSKATKEINQVEVSWDGQYLYSMATGAVDMPSTNKMEKQKYKNIRIKPWEVPYNENPSYLLWFALASSGYLKKQNTNVLNIPPLWAWVNSMNDDLFYTMINKYAPHSILPEMADVYIIPKVQGKDVDQGVSSGKKIIQIANIMKNEYKHAEYRVFEYYQENGKYIHPKRFGLRTYAVTIRNIPNSRQDRSYMRNHFIANITNIHTLRYTNWIPNMEGSPFITDYRMKREGLSDFRVGYHITNGIIPETNHPIVLEAVRRVEKAITMRKQYSENKDAAKRKTQHKFMVVFAVLALVPMVVFGWVTAAKRKNSNRRVSHENTE